MKTTQESKTNNNNHFTHHPVMEKEVIEGLALKPEGFYIDATFGRGGHAQAILAHLGNEGRLLVMDKDPAAIEVARKCFNQDPRVVIEAGSFANVLQSVKRLGWDGKVNGMLMDLGVSSPQLDDPERGFSFMREGPLDMRMNTAQALSAATWLNSAPEAEIAQVLKDYGEERFARRIARAVVAQRAIAPLVTTQQLVNVITEASPFRERFKHPATRTFQGIRIFINQELEELSQCLQDSLEVLSVGGRLAVISFHSLEDRIVKRFMRQHARGEALPREIPIMHASQPRLRILGRAIRSCEEEVQQNPRARSALLRIAEKLL